MTDLDNLIKAVEAGDDHATGTAVGNIASASRDHGLYWPSHDAVKAFRGSLDAAKALHDALLPGWRVEVFNLDGEVVLRRNRPIDRAYGDALNSGEVARAWLLAVLKAYRSEVQE